MPAKRRTGATKSTKQRAPEPAPTKAPPTTASVMAAATASDWRALDPENTLYLELATGRVVIELAPAFAPNHAANVKALVREGYFDGLTINRVQDNYVVQWGDANEGAARRPIKAAKETLPGEFDRAMAPDLPFTTAPDGDVYAAEAGWTMGFPAPAAYLPVDIAREFLCAFADTIAAAYPQLPVTPVCADFTRSLAPLAHQLLPGRRTVVYYPGSTIGNFVDADATALLANIAALLGLGGGLLIGVDLRKDITLLERAYNDSQGVTAAFNKNLLVRLNRELGADFAVEQFAHHAFYDREYGRIEMNLVSRRRQTVHIAAGHRFDFTEGEAIVTEHSHKYTLAGFAELAAAAGLQVRQVWTDCEQLFSVQYLTPA